LKKDARVVRVFFMFDCPYCFQYDASFWQWGKSLPRNWKLEFTPIFTGQPANYIWIRAFYAVQRAAPAHLERFMQLTYIATQQQKRNLLEQDTWRDIVRDAGINRAAFDAAWSSLENSEKLVGPVVDSTDHYRVEATPSVAIGGRYVITPDNTHGNPELFMQLLNAMISRAEGRA
jgi:thiol:disulfide interchange protein DsbA